MADSQDNDRILARALAARPTARQLAWQRLEYIAFAHFGINTFTDREWGDGAEDPALFNPTEFDADQWVAACCDAGMKLLILTAKHHDGFCLWPSVHTEHSLKNSPWRDGRGDVVAEVSAACARAGLKFGIYCSPWDRHERSYGDSPAYDAFFCAQLGELLSNYGPIAEVWLDGACGEGPNGKRQEYDWDSYYALVRQLQPEAAIAICGPDVRWVGNESGLARDDEWSVVSGPRGHGERGVDFLEVDNGANDLGSRGNLAENEVTFWYPAECDVSIRPGWFYHASQDLQVKSLEHLLDIYYRSVGRNSVLLLNVPPDQRGLFHENDVARLKELRAALDATFDQDVARDAQGGDAAVDGAWDTYWSAGSDVDELALDLGAEKTVDRLLLQEAIEEGQRVERFVLEGWHDGQWKEIVRGGCIGYKRLERFSRVVVRRVRLRIEASRAPARLRRIGLFRAP
ncbi:MAG: alpha-L-fucosidase [Candidatus Latescibacterota bacterium]|nr:alpha-L-fucosidase [Candidatus Latescibacterota bacterium]